jgi:hypothetical protein
MSMKHPRKYSVAADKKRRENRARVKDEERARRQKMAETQGEKQKKA